MPREDQALAPPTATDGGWPEVAPAAAFEETYAELQRVTEELEAGGLGLEDSMRLFERGLALADRCEAIVRRAELRLTQVLAEGDGPDPASPDGARPFPDGDPAF